jgi:hypothetical protein
MTGFGTGGYLLLRVIVYATSSLFSCARVLYPHCFLCFDMLDRQLVFSKKVFDTYS